MTTRGEAAFVGIGFRVASRDAFAGPSNRFRNRRMPPSGRRPIRGRRGSRRTAARIRLRREALAPIPSDGEPIVWNDAHGKNRLGRFQRPARVRRISCGSAMSRLFTPPPRATSTGMATPRHEAVRADPSGRRGEYVASFMHLDRGRDWTDHHTLAIVGAPARGWITCPSNAAISTTSAWGTWPCSIRATSIAGASAGISTAVRSLTTGPTPPVSMSSTYVDGDMVDTRIPDADSIPFDRARCFSGDRPSPASERFGQKRNFASVHTRSSRAARRDASHWDRTPWRERFKDCPFRRIEHSWIEHEAIGYADDLVRLPKMLGFTAQAASRLQGAAEAARCGRLVRTDGRKHRRDDRDPRRQSVSRRPGRAPRAPIYHGRSRMSRPL